MADLFQQLSKVPSKEQIEQIAKTGIVPSNMKGPEDKMYIAILREFVEPDEEVYCEICNDEPIDGYAIITIGRKSMFDKIKNFIMTSSEDINLDSSIVLVEGVDAGRGISLAKFINLCNNSYPDEAISKELIESLRSDNNHQATGFGGNAGTLMNE